MRILFVDSGLPGFPARYAFDIYSTLRDELKHEVRQLSPYRLTRCLIRNFNPDLLLVVHGTLTSPKLIQYARARRITTVLWIVEDPYEIDYHLGEMVAAYDYVFTNERQAVPVYDHPKVFYLPWCCNPQVHKRITVGSTYHSDLCFVGMGFPNRLRIINELSSLLKNLNVKLIGDWSSWGQLKPELKKFVLPIIDDFWEVQKYYNGAKINLNIHRDPFNPPSGNSHYIKAGSPNDRLFALAGCGAFQVLDNDRPDLWSCFEKNREIVAFNDSDQLAEVVKYYLKNPLERSAMVEAARERAYSEHTYKHRLLEVFRKVGKRIPGSPVAGGSARAPIPFLSGRGH